MIVTPHLGQACCPACLGPIAPEAAVVGCPTCQTAYHGECWAELGGCAVYGCSEMVAVKHAEDQVSTYWGDAEKTCPVCAELIPVDVVSCPLCRTEFHDARPLTAEGMMLLAADPQRKELGRSAMWLLIASVLGVTSPIALIVGGLWYRSNRQRIREVDQNVNAMVLISLGVSALYVVIVCVGVVVFLWANAWNEP